MKIKIVNRKPSVSCLMLAGAIAGIGMSMNVYAMQDIFMDIPGIPGESLEAVYEENIDVISASGNFSRRGCGDFVVTKYTDRATPLLISSVVSRKREPSIEINYRRGSGVEGLEYLRLTLNNVRFTTLETSANGADNRAIETLTMRAASITVAYTPQLADGSGDTQVVEEVECST